jgi:hypothetical protein
MKSARPFVLVLVASLLIVACNPFSDESIELTAALSGDDAVCEGDTCGGAGAGIADVEISSDHHKICWDISHLSETVGNATAFHVHSGARGDEGPVVVDLMSGNKSCTDVVSESVLRDISLHPAGFYVDVHSGRYPDGASRGQLGK